MAALKKANLIGNIAKVMLTGTEEGNGVFEKYRPALPVRQKNCTSNVIFDSLLPCCHLWGFGLIIQSALVMRIGIFVND